MSKVCPDCPERGAQPLENFSASRRADEHLKPDRKRTDARRSASRRELHEIALILKRQGWPQEYRLLCWNCNSAVAIYGVCPHQRALRVVA